jgi:hypothetical protein
MAHQFSGEQENRDFVPVARSNDGLTIHIDHIDRDSARRRQHRKLAQHLVAEAAPRTRVQQESHALSVGEARRRCKS